MRELDKDERAIKRALDSWCATNGFSQRPEHIEIAQWIKREIEHRFRKPHADRALLVDVDDAGHYVNPRLVENSGSPEELLYPIDPETDEPVEEAVAHYALFLPDPEHVQEI